MPQICLYLHLHQPYRLRDYHIDELGLNHAYFSLDKREDSNRDVFLKVAKKSYLPMLTLLLKLIQEQPGFSVSFSLTGTFLEQAAQYQPKVIELLKKLVASGRVELLAETYHHSLASLYSEAEFSLQVSQHKNILKELFNYSPVTFRNTELVYSNDIGRSVAALGFHGMLTEGVERILCGRPKTQVYYSVGNEQLPILLKHAELSDDIAFRFSDKKWYWHPLSSEQYLRWVELYREDELINLFMDFETFGEHQWKDSGIFDFFSHFVRKFLAHSWNSFVTPRQVLARTPFKVLRPEKRTKLVDKKQTQKNSEISTSFIKKTPRAHWRTALPRVAPNELRYDAPYPISWADVDRDLSAWLENAFQQDCLGQIYAVEDAVLQSQNQKLIEDWRRLQTSDHFYYMCTKWSADGDVHAYFSPYRDPYEAYRRYSLILADFKDRILAAQ